MHQSIKRKQLNPVQKTAPETAKVLAQMAQQICCVAGCPICAWLVMSTKLQFKN
jgi:hypothetical protein